MAGFDDVVTHSLASALKDPSLTSLRIAICDLTLDHFTIIGPCLKETQLTEDNIFYLNDQNL